MTVLDESFDLKILKNAGNYQRWLLSYFGPALSGHIVEVGPGIGNFTRWLAGGVCKVVVVESEPAMCVEISALDLPNVEIKRGFFEEVAVTIPPADAVLLCNVLEHIEDDAAALRAAHSILRDQGHVCIVVPAHQQLYGSLDRRYGHLRRYRRAAVERALESAGFVNVKAEYFNPVGALGWFAVSRLAKRPRLSRGSVMLSERIAVPLGRTLRRFGSPPFGQSVVAIGRKAGPGTP